MDSTLDRRGRGAGVDGRSPETASPKSRGGDEAPVKDADSTRSLPKKSRAPFDPARMDSPLGRRGLGLGRGVSVVDGRSGDAQESDERSGEYEPVKDIDGWSAGMPSSGVGGSRTEAFPAPAADGVSTE